MAQLTFSRHDILTPNFKEIAAFVNGRPARIGLNGSTFDGVLFSSNLTAAIPTITFSSDEVGVDVELVSNDYNNGYLHTFGGAVVLG